ncbi:MAG: SPOR domain-containing protein [Pseudomonadota bacterium]
MRYYLNGMAFRFLPLKSIYVLPAMVAGATLLAPDFADGNAWAFQDDGQSSLQVRSPEGTLELGDALQRLARNSRDLNALIDAGNAALTLGDPTAAIGFFARAEEIDPRNGRVKAGLGKAVLGKENPYEALRLFDEASALGVTDSAIAAERGLAYDLVGKQELAQQDYQLALRRSGDDDELIRRYALSLGISGRKDEAESLLTPLLRQQDVAAWRMRAFILAINEDLDGAIAISDATMQPRGARAIRPFLNYFPKLTPSQQAAAAHFGHFPQEANIGRDNPRNAEFASRSTTGSSRRTFSGSRADAGLIPVGEPLGTQSGDTKPERVVDKAPRRRPGRGSTDTDLQQTNAVAEATDDPRNENLEQVAVAEAIRETERAAAAPAETEAETVQLASAGAAIDAPEAIAAQAPEVLLPEEMEATREAVADVTAVTQTGTDTSEIQAASSSPKVPVPGFESLGDPATNSFDLADAGSTTDNGSVAAITTVEETVQEANTGPTDFASLMADLSVPEQELARDQAAVDITTITPAKPKPKPAPKPAEPKHPSRHWVQVAGGANIAGLNNEWRRLARLAPDAFAGKKGWTTPLNRTNRVLAGPFGSKREAQSFVNLLAKSEISAFTFTSETGQVITPLK